MNRRPDDPIAHATNLLARESQIVQSGPAGGEAVTCTLFPVLMLRALREFRIGRPQIFAGLLLLAFLGQCMWVAAGRKFTRLESEYIASGLPQQQGRQIGLSSPLTGLAGALPVRLVSAIKGGAPASMKDALTMPRLWVRLPFLIFGLWLGGALWWVARRLFGDRGGYVALALYCFSPAMVMISSNIGPEIILAWSSFGLIYTAIGVAHTLYAPPRKWAPRILILGVAIGICLSTAVWSFTIVLLAFVFMFYLSPGRRWPSAVVLLGASVIGLAVRAVASWAAGVPPLPSLNLITPSPSFEMVRNLGFVFADGYELAALLVLALTVYGSWGRVRYFGNTAPLIVSFAIVSLFALLPAVHVWEAALGLSFTFLFIGGVAADVLETSWRRAVTVILAAILAVKCVLALRLLSVWIHQNSV